MNPHFSLPSLKSLAKSPDAALLNLTVVGVWAFGLGMLGFVLIRAFSPLELNFNEGWNGYHQLAAQRGENVYPPSSALYFNNYPPLSFLLVGYVGRLGLDVVLVGRLISTLSVLATAIFCGVTLSNLTDRTWRTTALGASICLASLCVASTGYVGVNDPQFLAHALMTAALAAYTRSADGSLKSTVVLMALAGMTKHNILAAPLAVAADTLHRIPSQVLEICSALGCCTFSVLYLAPFRLGWSDLGELVEPKSLFVCPCHRSGEGFCEDCVCHAFVWCPWSYGRSTGMAFTLCVRVWRDVLAGGSSCKQRRGHLAKYVL